MAATRRNIYGIGFNTTSNTTIGTGAPTGTDYPQVGDYVVVMTTFDNQSGTTPTATAMSMSGGGGAVGAFTILNEGTSNVATALGSVRVAIGYAQVTTAYTSGPTANVTLSVATPIRTIGWTAVTGAANPAAFNSAAAGIATTFSYTGAVAAPDTIGIFAVGTEANAAPSVTAGTVVASVGSASGGSAANVFMSIVSSTGNLAGTVSDGGVIGVLFEDASTSTPVSGAETGTFSVTETSSLAQTNSVSITDTGTFSASTETSSLAQSNFTTTDAGTFSVTGTAAIASTISTTDSGTFSATETSALSVVLSATDTGTFSATDTVTTQTLTSSRTDTGTFSATETASVNSVTGNVLTQSGLLTTEVDTAYSASIDTTTELYVVPTATNLADMQSAWNYIMAGNLLTAAGIVNQYDYDVVDFTDTLTSRNYWMLRERVPVGGTVARGWGLYVWAPDSPNRTIYQVPHIRHDLYTQLEGVQGFNKEYGKALFQAGSHRYANAQTVNGDSVADVANITDPPSSVFNYINSATVAGTDEFVIQYHGFGDTAVQPYGGVLWRGQSNYDSGDNLVTGATLNKPARVVQGDRIYAVVAVRDSTNVITPPSGWTLKHNQSDGTLLQASLYERIVGASEPTTYSFSWTVASRAEIGMVAYQGTSGIDVSAVGIETGSSVTAHDPPSVTPTVNDTIGFTVLTAASSSTYATPTGVAHVQRIDTPSGGASSVNLGWFDTDGYTSASGVAYQPSTTSSLGFSTGVFFTVRLKPTSTPTQTDIVISTGLVSAQADTKIYALRDAFIAAGYNTYVNEGQVDWTASGNVQGVHTRGQGSIFCHIEQRTGIRNTSASRDTITSVVSNAAKTNSTSITKNAYDNATFSATETSALTVLNAVTATDTGTFSATETASNNTGSASPSASDTGTFSITEASVSSSTLSRTDTGTFSATDTSASLSTLAANDTGTFSATDTSVSQSTLSRTDTGTFSITETSSLVIVATIGASDSGTFSATETATAPQIVNAISTTDAGTFSAGTESSSSQSTLSRTDVGTFSASGETSASTGTFARSDTGTFSTTDTSASAGTLSGTDTGTFSASGQVAAVGILILKTANDTGTFSVTSTAVAGDALHTRVSAWNGTTMKAVQNVRYWNGTTFKNIIVHRWDGTTFV